MKHIAQRARVAVPSAMPTAAKTLTMGGTLLRTFRPARPAGCFPGQCCHTSRRHLCASLSLTIARGGLGRSARALAHASLQPAMQSTVPTPATHASLTFRKHVLMSLNERARPANDTTVDCRRRARTTRWWGGFCFCLR